MGMFESKNEKLYTAKDTLQDVEPSTLTEFGQNVSDNLTVLGNRISSIMSGSSDDSWDDKVKTQITSAIEKIGTSVKEEQKTAEVVKGASSILSTLKSALEEYVLGYDSWETHVNSEPTEKTETYTEEGSTEPKTRYTQKYLDWEKEDAILRKTVPELEEQAKTWMEQMKTYFEAYNFETHEIDTTIYKENKDPLKFYGDLYKQYESEYVPKEEEENVVPAVPEGIPEIKTTETTDSSGNKRKTNSTYVNGVLISDEYTVVDQNDTVIESGSHTYYENGNIATWEYDNGTDEEGNKVKNAKLTYYENGTVKTRHYDEREADNQKQENYDVEYREDGTRVRRHIDKVTFDNGETHEDYEETYNTEDKMTTKIIKTITLSDGEKQETVKRTYAEDNSHTFEAEKITETDGTVLEGYKEEYDATGRETRRTIATRTFSDGGKQETVKWTYAEDNSYIFEAEKITSADGEVSEGYKDEYDTKGRRTRTTIAKRTCANGEKQEDIKYRYTFAEDFHIDFK